MKTKTRKLLAVLALITLMLTMLPISMSNAATKPTLSIGSAEAKVGQMVTVEVKLSEKVEMISFATEVNFNKDKLEVVKVEQGTVMQQLKGNLDNTDVQSANNVGAIVFTAAGNSNQTLQAGVIGKIQFKVKNGAVGQQDLNLTLTELYYSESVGNEVDKADTVATTSGKINVIIPVETITLNKNANSVNVGVSETLVATVKPDTATNKTVTWTTSDAKVATVTNGVVKAVGPGKATITAKAGDKTATYTIDVKAPLTGIKLNTTSENMLKNQELDLKVEYIPSNTTDDRTVTWTSTDATVAKVENGHVTALKEGTAVITAKVGTYTAACAINVKEIKLDSIAFAEKDFELFRGDSRELTIIYNPANTTDSRTAKWESSDESVVKVENGIVTALKIGTATITATVGGDKTATVKVTVPEVLIEGVELFADSTKIEVGEKTLLGIATNPERVTEDIKPVFKSSNEQVVTVSEDGIVTGVNVGKAKITVTVNGKFESEVEIEVVEKAVEEEKPVLPKTGEMAIGAFVVLMVVSLAGIVFVVVRKIRK